MAKKSDKKDKKKAAPAKKKPVAKPAKKAAPKKVAKPAKKAAPKKPAAAKGKAVAAKKVVTGKKAAPAPVKGKAAAKPIPAKVAEKAAKSKKEEASKGKAAPAPVEEIVETEALEEEVPEEVVLTDAEGRRYCRVKDCDQLSAVDGYCRFHYLLFWKKIQVRKKILSEGKLERYVEELTARYPDKFLDMLRKDLRSEKEFLAAIQELEIDESAVDNEFEEETQTYIDEVRGMGEPTGAREEEDF
ncbi:MAG: hypothetical protein KF799_12750 [Bdellovibrionales bacterium]|nr:hypothetical protein [Bdellovibrionales bacterium]